MKLNQVPDYRELDRGAFFLLVLGITAIFVGLCTGFVTLNAPTSSNPYGGGSQGPAILIVKIVSAAWQLVPGVLIVISAYVLWAFRDMAINSWRLANTLAPPVVPAPKPLLWRIRGMHKDDGEVDLVIAAMSEAEARSLAFERGIQVVSISRIT